MALILPILLVDLRPVDGVVGGGVRHAVGHGDPEGHRPPAGAKLA